jgi:hypothetical protein
MNKKQLVVNYAQRITKLLFAILKVIYLFMGIISILALIFLGINSFYKEIKLDSPFKQIWFFIIVGSIINLLNSYYKTRSHKKS